MYGIRFALVTLMVALVAVTLGAPSSSTGQSEQSPGRSYGGVKDLETVWLRLDASRAFVSALEIPWGVDPERCSRKIWHRSTVFAGSVYSDAIRVSPAGRFKTTVVDRYSVGGSRYEERQTVVGTIDGHMAGGSISGRLRISRPDGQVVRCSFGPQRWRAAD